MKAVFEQTDSIAANGPKQRQALESLKAEVVRIGTNGTRTGFKFAESMFKKYPELREA